MPHHVLGMADGSVAVMQTVGDATVEECLAKWPEAERAKVTTIVKDYPPEILPQDRTYRNAWTLRVAAVVHDMSKARAILRDRLRAERAPLLAALDVDFIRASENITVPDLVQTTSSIIATKQLLRDVTENPAIDLAMTVDELKSLTLDALTVAPIAAAVADAKPLA